MLILLTMVNYPVKARSLCQNNYSMNFVFFQENSPCQGAFFVRKAVC